MQSDGKTGYFYNSDRCSEMSSNSDTTYAGPLTLSAAISGMSSDFSINFVTFPMATVLPAHECQRGGSRSHEGGPCSPSSRNVNLPNIL